MAAVLVLASCGGGEGASVSIDSPENGATVDSPVRIAMSAKALKIERAGAVQKGAGHFHLLIDLLCDEPGVVAPADAQHVRIDDGRAAVDIPLTPGTHTLCLQAADGNHAALAQTDQISVRVAGVRAERWEGTIRGEEKAGPNCEAATNTGHFVVRVVAGKRVSGRGQVSASAYTCTLPEGRRTIPARTNTVTLTGEKRPEFFRLRFSNGVGVRLASARIQARGMIEVSAGDYTARATVTMRCVC